MRFHFIGTDYAPPPLGREWALPVARAEGVDEYVHEHCHRVPYFDALHYLKHADGLMMLGSNDSSYTASKLFPYILAERPLLLVFHEGSLVTKLAAEVGAGRLFPFGDSTEIDDLAGEVYEHWFVRGGWRNYHAVDADRFQPFTAANMTRQLAACFAAAGSIAT